MNVLGGAQPPSDEIGLALRGASACATEARRRACGQAPDARFGVPLAMLADLAERLCLPSDLRELGPLVIEREARVLVRGKELSLPKKEFALLARLASDPDSVFTHERLLRDVWGYPSACQTSTLKTHACALRAHLAAAGLPGWVVNVWGVGYRLRPGRAA